jgi:hypothetical protein
MSTFLFVRGTQLGPFSDEDVTKMLSRKEASLDDLAWKEGMVEWLPLKSFFPSAEIATPVQAKAPLPRIDEESDEKLKSACRTARQMVLMFVIGIFIPLVWVIWGVLGLIHFIRWKKISARMASGSCRLSYDGELCADYLRDNQLRLLVPGIAFLVELLIAGIGISLGAR